MVAGKASTSRQSLQADQFEIDRFQPGPARAVTQIHAIETGLWLEAAGHLLVVVSTQVPRIFGLGSFSGHFPDVQHVLRQPTQLVDLRKTSNIAFILNYINMQSANRKQK